jgi:hypothetical protein
MLKKYILLTFMSIPSLLGACLPQQGPNRLQSAPVLTSAVNNDGVITVQGALATIRRNATFIIQFFGNPTNRNPITEGADFLGQITITTDCNGLGAFTAQLPPTQINDPFISATATLVLADGTLSDTSMFSLNIPIA